MTKTPAVGNIVEDYYISKTHIVICDDTYRDKSEAEINRILDRINSIGLQIILENQAKSKNL